MARRSPNNPRYQKDSKVGKTRRSAASAKPKRDAGESGGSKPSSAKGSKSKMPIEPDTPEFRRWRKIWLGLLVAAIIFVGGSFLTREASPVSSNASLVFAYATLFTALWIDFTKIRRMRKEWREQLASGGNKKSKKAESSKADSKKAEDTEGDA